MKIYHVLQGLASSSAGTTIYVNKLAANLKALNYDVRVVALGKSPQEWENHEQLVMFKNRLSCAGLPSKETVSYVRDELNNNGHIIHAHGIWRTANLFPLVITGQTKYRILWSPHGMFTEWSWNHHWLRKQIIWYTLQQPALRSAFCFHATSADEIEDIRRLGFRQPVALVPIGVDVQSNPAKRKDERILLYLSRIHKKKGLHILVEAWKEIVNRYPEWVLHIVGDTNNTYGQETIRYAESQKIPQLRFLGEITGSEKNRIYKQASLFILPSFSENFGIAIAEALANGLPVITTVHTPWQELTNRGCGWCVSADVASIKNALCSALSLDVNTLDEMGARGQKWMEREYSWQKVTKMMIQVYQWMHNKSDSPSFIHF